jgi:DNA helicase-2/ATP-dependent DNA helicase PcrA
MFKIDDEDIYLAERLLLPEGEVFDKERRDVIRCMDSKDIQACPGSGKTTTLLAKLSIIARQLPLKTNQGICVLTHTNVAVDEIRDRLDGKADILFQYPNHFGTIQSFVNKFMAIPSYINRYGKRVARIDDEIYTEYIQRRSSILDRGAKYWLEVNKISPVDLRFSLHDFCITKKIDGQILMKPESKTYPKLKQFKEDILKEGILCYEDAYSLAYEYLRKYPEIVEVISDRFAYVFIDEMQDTDYIQNDLLERVFDRKKVIIQRIGDTNQSIFNSPSEAGWNVFDECLPISDSKRFSCEIAERVKKICLSPQDLKGNSNIPNIAPKLIVFDDSSISKAIPVFGDFILEYKLHELKRKVFKAVGWVGQSNGQRSISDYYEPYGKSELKRRHDYDCLADYLKMAIGEERGDSIEVKRSLIFKAMLKSLRLLGVKRANNLPYTDASFNDYLSKLHKDFYDKVRFEITEWCLRLHRKEDILQDVKGFINNDLCLQMGVKPNRNLQYFLNTPTSIEPIMDNQKTNLYVHEKNDENISIGISTVHSVKGETHTATLYLETYFNKKFDVQSIIEYMKGKHSPPKLVTTKHSLKMAYVGMTRPTHLLCVATHKDSCESHLDELARVGWDIHKIY